MSPKFKLSYSPFLLLFGDKNPRFVSISVKSASKKTVSERHSVFCSGQIYLIEMLFEAGIIFYKPQPKGD